MAVFLFMKAGKGSLPIAFVIRSIISVAVSVLSVFALQWEHKTPFRTATCFPWDQCASLHGFVHDTKKTPDSEGDWTTSPRVGSRLLLVYAMAVVFALGFMVFPNSRSKSDGFGTLR